jgi:hypothetical protein
MNRSQVPDKDADFELRSIFGQSPQKITERLRLIGIQSSRRIEIPADNQDRVPRLLQRIPEVGEICLSINKHSCPLSRLDAEAIPARPQDGRDWWIRTGAGFNRYDGPAPENECSVTDRI